VLLTATGTAGALAFAGWALLDRLWRARHAVRSAASRLSSKELAMPADQRPADPGPRSNPRKTPAERAEEFAAEQARLKREAAARRAAAEAATAAEARPQPAA
jgi:hypothetical protein